MTTPAFAAPPPSDAAGRGMAGPRRRARIGLTPLIDVVFILLVFFMLASSFLDERAIEVAAPPTSLGGASMEGAVLLELRPDGPRLSGRAVSEAELAARLAEHAARNPAQRIVIKPARGVSLQQTVGLLDRVLAAGLTQISFARDPAG